MQRILSTLAIIALGMVCGIADASAATRIGALSCEVSRGVGVIITSTRALGCTFRPVDGRPELYFGTVRRYGVDLGFTGPGHLVWAVFSSSRLGPGQLAGDYYGATGSFSVGVGIGANALVGGSGRGISLQPLSVEAQTGASIAAGVGAMTLEFGNAVR